MWTLKVEVEMNKKDDTKTDDTELVCGYLADSGSYLAVKDTKQKENLDSRLATKKER